MRWCHPRKANIDTELRETFEQYGLVSMQVVLGATNFIYHKGKSVSAELIRDPLLQWLREEYDKEDIRRTWSITMEVAITFLVAVEVLLQLFPSAREFIVCFFHLLFHLLF